MHYPILSHRVNGYFSVEAALIMPIVVFVIAFLFYATYFMYGRCMIAQDAYILSFRASMEREQETGMDRETYVFDRFPSQIKNKYFGCLTPIVESEASGEMITVSGVSRVKVSAFKNYEMMPGSPFSFCGIGKATHRNYTEHIRKIRRFSDIGESLLEKDE